MDPVLHWVDIDLDPALAGLQGILVLIGTVYFGYSYWRLKHRLRNLTVNPPVTDHKANGTSAQ